MLFEQRASHESHKNGSHYLGKQAGQFECGSVVWRNNKTMSKPRMAHADIKKNLPINETNKKLYIFASGAVCAL